MNAEEGELDQEMRLSEPRLWESEFPPEAEKKGMMKEMNSMKNFGRHRLLCGGGGGKREFTPQVFRSGSFEAKETDGALQLEALVARHAGDWLCGMVGCKSSWAALPGMP